MSNLKENDNERIAETEKPWQVLAEENYPYAVAYAKHIRRKFGNQNLDYEDIVQYAAEGLVIAAKKYDPKRYETKFTTYAYFWMQDAVYRGILREFGINSIHKNLWLELSQYRALKKQGADIHRIMKELKIERDTVMVLESLASPTLSLDADEDTNDDEYIPLYDRIADPSASATEQIEKSVDNEQLFNALYRVLDQLPEKKRKIVSAYFGLSGEPKSLRDLVDAEITTPAGIRSTLSTALKEIRHALAKEGIKGIE